MMLSKKIPLRYDKLGDINWYGNGNYQGNQFDDGGNGNSFVSSGSENEENSVVLSTEDREGEKVVLPSKR